jgi:hypothetical protein
MEGNPGDRIIIKTRRIGQVAREGEILEAHGPGGTAPFLVRWFEDGHTALFFPGSDAEIRHRDETPPNPRGGKVGSAA